MLQTLIKLLSFLPKEALVFILGAMPVSELRGAIPLGLGLNIPVFKTVLLAVAGNILPVIPLLLFLGPVSDWLIKKHDIFKRFFHWLFERTRKHSDKVEKYEELGLILFVAIPLPMTGAWSGTIAAFMFGIKFWKALLCIVIGILIAATIVSLVSTGAISLGAAATKLLTAH